MIGLTARQRDCWEFVREYHREYGIMPSLSQIAVGIGGGNRSRIHYLMSGLVERGHIRRIQILGRPGYDITTQYYAFNPTTKQLERLI
jgi:SOS-response transcriptional repressor LexA